MATSAVADRLDCTDPANRPRVLFLNRSYWPDSEATGQLLTELCEDLSSRFEVTVIAGQPHQNPLGESFRRVGVESRCGVTIRRVRHTRFPKRSFVGRAANLLSYLAAATWAALTIRRPDIVVTETDPLFLALVGGWLRGWRGCRHVAYLQDIYPDIAVGLGKVREGWLTKRIRRALLATYRRADRVIVLSDDMRSLLVEWGLPRERIEVIPNWTDTSLVTPIKRNNPFRLRERLADKFVVMYSGNMGLSQRLEDVLDAADRLRDQPEIACVLVGDGASKTNLEQIAHDRRLDNVRFLPYQPKSELATSLSAADVQLITVDPRIPRCLMPSKLYGILASGTPVIVVAPLDSELSRLVRGADVGRTIAPGDSAALADAIRWCAAHRDALAGMGQHARELAVSQYDRAIRTRQFEEMLEETAAVPGSSRGTPQSS